ncbi:MAG: glycerophosphodiester phosphodiesterase [Lysobacterales bacterium]
MRALPAVALCSLLAACGTLTSMPTPSKSSTPMKDFTVIAHRGASGYLPEHTLEGAAMAHAMGADYIEQDVLLTRDGVLIVLHDLYLDAVTDVAERYPGRARPDGRHYAIDFTLEEIRRLRVHERTGPDGEPAFPGRFTQETSIFHVPTLAEEIDLIEGLNRSTGRHVGLYIEPKAPAWHEAEGKDLMVAVLALLANHGLNDADDKVLLQSFDFDALRRAREELGTELGLVQLIGENDWQESRTDFAFLQTEAGLREVARFARGIGPWLPQVVQVKDDGSMGISDLTAMAQRLGLFVHAYTLRADQLPPALGSMPEAVRVLVEEVQLDGVFTDHPDQVIASLSAP